MKDKGNLIKWLKRGKRIILWGGGSLFLLIFVCNWIIVYSVASQIYDDVEEIPGNRVGLLLGTSPRLKGGKPNLYFSYRIDAAVKLYQQRKISRILVSGDNRKRDYNEPEEMRRALVAKGIPDSVIVLDYAGIRTLDSVIRAKKVFGQNKITVISQCFHNERALFIANFNGIQAVGYNADDVDVYSGFKTQLREWLARVKVFIDLLTDKEPRHLGNPVSIR